MGKTHHSSRILIVDDTEANVLLLERILGSAGYERVRSTTEPKRVMDLYRDFKPDLILLDLHMPELDGFAVMNKLSDEIAEDDYVPILVLTADITTPTKQRALLAQAKDFLTKPFDTAEVLARVGNLLETRSLHLQLRGMNELLEKKVQERTTALWDSLNQLERAHSDLRLAQEETIHSLAMAAEFRDDETSRHIERMSRYCWIVAGSMGFDDGDRETLRIAAKLHDIGKLGIADAILNKPGKLTDDEYTAMKTHAQLGYDILKRSTSGLAVMAAEIAWTHHEKVDGSGYPRGLAGTDIPIQGRIAAVADVFDALTTDRIYRKAFGLPDALTIMREGRGTHFDSEILDVFFDHIDEVLVMKQNLEEPAA